MKNARPGKICNNYITYYNAFAPNQLGFTLIELLTVLSLIALLSGIWIIPAYQQWLQNYHLEIKAKQLFFTLKFAQATARQQATKVTVCKSKDHQSCGGLWQEGWIVLAHLNPHEPPKLLQSHPGLYLQQYLTLKTARNLEVIQFQPFGNSSGYNGRFVLCSKGSKIAWLIIISPTGRVRLEPSRDLSYCRPFT